jgi:hypothetical protein
MDAFEWVFRRQIAAALTMAHVDKGWKGSRRQDALLTLLYGPVDWTATAALVAMIEIARNEPAHTSEIMAMLREELEGVVNPIRWSCIQQPLLDLLERLPIEDDLRKLLARMRAESESRE